jgi:chromosome segregation ATPase
LQDHHRRGKREGPKAVVELAAGQDRMQSSTDEDGPWPVRPNSETKKQKLLMTDEMNALISEFGEMQVNFGDIQTENGALSENFGKMREGCDIPQKDEDKLKQEYTTKMLDGELSNQKDCLILNQVRETLMLEHEELKIKYQKLERECNALQRSVIDIREKCSALQKDKEMLVCLQDVFKMLIDEEPRHEEVCSGVTQEINSLRSKQQKFETKFKALKQECLAQRENVLAEDCDVLQRVNDELASLKDRMKMTLDEKSIIEKSHLTLTQERDTLKLVEEELKNSLHKAEQECIALEENVNNLRAERDALQSDNEKLISREAGMKMIIEELTSIEVAHFLLTQENHTLKSERDELETSVKVLKEERLALTETVNCLREENEGMHRDRDELVVVRSRWDTMLDQKIRIERDLLTATQEREAFRLEREELQNRLNKCQRECIALVGDVHALREEQDVLQRENEKLLSLEQRMRMMIVEVSSIQNAHLADLQDREDLRSQGAELENKFDNVKQACLTLKENYNNLKEERDVLQKDIEKLIILEGRMKMLTETHLVVTRENHILRSERDELETSVKELKEERLALKAIVESLREEIEGGQSVRDELHVARRRLDMTVSQKTSIERAYVIMTQDRDRLSSQRKKLKNDLNIYKQQCLTLKENMKSLRTRCDILEWQNEDLIQLKVRMSMAVDELTEFENAYWTVVQENHTLESERDELETSVKERKQECVALTETINAMREEAEGMQNVRDELTVLERKLVNTLAQKSSIEKAYLEVAQERDTLRSELRELDNYLYKCKQDYITLSEERAALQRARVQRTHLVEGQERNILQSEQEEIKNIFDDVKQSDPDLEVNLSTSLSQSRRQSGKQD